ncbi:MAG: hypothetical protein GEU79_12530 [Acidimicrobiia bacterium]|nr:hypothetical protein [Acidimicrobiia bacterium]
MTTITAPHLVTAPSARFKRTLGLGGLAGGAITFVAAIGMLEAFTARLIISPFLNLGYLVLFSIPFLIGFLIARRVEVEGVETEPRSGADIVAAVTAGLIAGLIVGGFTALVSAVPDLRGTFPNLSPVLVDTLTMDRGLGLGVVLLTVISIVAAVAGAATHWLPTRITRALSVGVQAVVVLAVFQTVVDDLFDWFTALPDALYAQGGGLTIVSAVLVFALSVGLSLFLPGRVPSIRDTIASDDAKKRTRNSLILAGVIAVVVIILPQFLGGVLNALLTNVGLFLLMGLGLNIVVGSAGLLDLGYVAFFAVGAYTTAVLTSPLSPFWNPELSWWLAFPVVLIMATIAGVMVGTPVIRMRGDYLAIVTLGFGEIVRILLLSDWLAPYFGGAQGIRNIPGIPVGGAQINATTPDLFIYATMTLVAVAAYISWRLQDSRIGRAWAAMREDEDVAEAIGIDTVKAKLLAFVTGAILASFAGALFSAKVGSVFTTSFEIIVSIVLLVIVIVGGMGSIAGVAVGALVLIGILGGPNLPGLLQEFGEFKLLIYGALLVYMMLQRPEGLIPSTRRARELHQEEFLQDAWLDAETPVAETEGA